VEVRERQFSKASILESHADKIALAPNQPALSDGTKIIERQIEMLREHVEVVQPEPCSGLGEVADFAGKYAALGAKEQQRAF
jgi:hypothetical protein